MSSGNKEDWNVILIGKEDDRNLKNFEFSASLIFFNDSFNKGACCIAQRNSNELFDIVIFELNKENNWLISEKLAENLEEKVNAFFYFNKNDESDGWLIGVSVDVCFYF